MNIAAIEAIKAARERDTYRIVDDMEEPITAIRNLLPIAHGMLEPSFEEFNLGRYDPTVRRGQVRTPSAMKSRFMIRGSTLVHGTPTQAGGWTRAKEIGGSWELRTRSAWQYIRAHARGGARKISTTNDLF